MEQNLKILSVDIAKVILKTKNNFGPDPSGKRFEPPKTTSLPASKDMTWPNDFCKIKCLNFEWGVSEEER